MNWEEVHREGKGDFVHTKGSKNSDSYHTLGPSSAPDSKMRSFRLLTVGTEPQTVGSFPSLLSSFGQSTKWVPD